MRYRLHAITPVHVGCGIRMGRMDYVRRKDKLLVMDIQRLASLPGIDPEDLADLLYLSDFDMGKFLESKGIDPAAATTRSVRCGCNPQSEVLCCIKDGTGMAYLPGSSIKGALRTAILWERIKGTTDQIKDKARSEISSSIRNSRSRDARAHASDRLQKIFLGKDQYHDHLRALSVSDSEQIPMDALEVFKVVLMSLAGDRLREKMSIYVEAIRPGTEAEISIDLDRFLCSDYAVSRLGLQMDDLWQLERITRSYYEDYVTSEINFLSRHLLDEQKGGPAEFYRKLLLLPEKRGGMLLRLGWGGGWHGMTVARLFPEQLDDLRRAFRLGRLNVPEFPKTRRLAQTNAGMLPIGWVWLRPV
ncbi:MAG: type III-A CRISPR-associated RAMP protein Csm5 [Methanotrichaceae archaeon]|nr:type III-A CRISPR-associated RAMP protein Csm5 [Methanotrichaceae archaeon]